MVEKRKTGGRQQYLPWLPIGAALLLLIWRSLRFGGFFPDDAYITFRFAEHLADGLGIVWNVGGPPVEGSTSFLQTLLLAVTRKAGLATAFSAYLFNAVGVAALTSLFYASVVRLAGRFRLGAALALALFVGGVHFNVHVISGMETIIDMALLTASFLAALTFLDRPTWRAALVLAAVNFLCLWCRPDGAPYIAGQGLVLGVVALGGWMRGRNRETLVPLIGSFALLVGLGGAFLLWKISYFGYILPNSYYVKAADPLAFEGLSEVAAFLKDIGLRLGLLVPLAVFADWRGLLAGSAGRVPARLALLVVPAAVFLAFGTTVLPVVGFNYRFEYPVAAFFWIAAAWLLTAGRAGTRLGGAIAALSGPAAGGVVAAALALGLLAVQFQLDRPLHRKWFSYIEVVHYAPIAKALRRSGAGSAGTLVFDSAGFIPYMSGFSLIDPVGLTDNVLSGRDPITALGREEYIWGANPDVYLGPVPPASPGAATGREDPLVQSVYVQDVLLKTISFASYRRILGRLSYDERLEALHFRMRELRDHWIAVGEVPYPFPIPKEYTHFLYVRANSPFADKLVTELDRVVTRRMDEIDFDDLLAGQRALTALDVAGLFPNE